METQETISKWGVETFGLKPKTQEALQIHWLKLEEELEELHRDICIDGDYDKCASEFADVYIVLAQIASTVGVDLQEAVDKKMTINRKRTWIKSSNGTFRHGEGQ